MYIILICFLAVFYLVMSYINFSKLMFLENYQILLNVRESLEVLCYYSLFSAFLGAALFLMIFKLFPHIKSNTIEHKILNRLIKPAYFCILVGVAISCLTLFYSLFYISGFASHLQPTQAWNEEEIYRISVHEAGHILIREIELPNSTIKAQIIPVKDIVKSNSYFEQSLPAGFVAGTKSSRINTVSQIEKSIRIYLAGLAAEEIVFGKKHVSTNASDDLSKIEDLIKKLCNSGLSPAGPVTWQVMSEEEKSKLYNDIVTEQYKTVVDILKANKTILLKLADELAANQTLTSNQINDIMSK